MITLRAIGAALCRALVAKREQQEREAAELAAKRRKQEEIEAAWREELRRRQEIAADVDGRYAAARAERQRQIEEDQLADMTAALIRRTKRT